jgi:hypothetical protein
MSSSGKEVMSLNAVTRGVTRGISSGFISAGSLTSDFLTVALDL